MNKSYFCGAWTEDRDEVFSKLTDFDIIFRGWNWDKLSKTSSNFDISNGTISLDDQLKDYNKYFAVINKHQINNTPISSLNLRVFEAPSCGALLINDYREGLENYFDLEKEICVYNCIEDLIETLERLKKEPKVFDKIRENGYRRVLNEHTYAHRLTEVHRLFNEM